MIHNYHKEWHKEFHGNGGRGTCKNRTQLRRSAIESFASTRKTKSTGSTDNRKRASVCRSVRRTVRRTDAQNDARAEETASGTATAQMRGPRGPPGCFAPRGRATTPTQSAATPPAPARTPAARAPPSRSAGAAGPPGPHVGDRALAIRRGAAPAGRTPGPSRSHTTSVRSATAGRNQRRRGNVNDKWDRSCWTEWRARQCERNKQLRWVGHPGQRFNDFIRRWYFEPDKRCDDSRCWF